MIVLPPELCPARLLCLDDLGPSTRDLLRDALALRQEGDWQAAEQCARDALEVSRSSRQRLGRGAALVYLSDIHFVGGRLGLARKEANNGYRLFRTSPSRYQRHNEGVAAYALGLTCQCLGDRAAALRWYQTATDLFSRVSRDWIAANASSQVTRCQRASDWIEELSRSLRHAQAGPMTGSTERIWLPLVRLDVEDAAVEYAVAQLDVEEYVVAGTLRVGDHAYRIELLDGPGSLSLDTNTTYYARQIPAKALTLLDANRGDYALIQREKEPCQEGPGVVESLSGAEFGHFERDDSGKIRFVGTDATVIGDDDIRDDLEIGYVAALLRRATP